MLANGYSSVLCLPLLMLFISFVFVDNSHDPHTHTNTKACISASVFVNFIVIELLVSYVVGVYIVPRSRLLNFLLDFSLVRSITQKDFRPFAMDPGRNARLPYCDKASAYARWRFSDVMVEACDSTNDRTATMLDLFEMSREITAVERGSSLEANLANGLPLGYRTDVGVS